MSRRYSRREMLARTAAGLAVGFVGGSKCFGTDLSRSGAIVGETAGAEVGKNVLASAGNAVDAAVGAALTSAVATPARCGIAGYGGHMIIALKSGKVTCIDFNTMGPAAARPDMYPLDEKGEVKGGTNLHGWLAIGVPGTLAGLQLALDRYGTKPFRELVQPAIEVAKNGFVLSPGTAKTIRGAAARFRNDPGSAKLYLDKNGEARAPGDLMRNPDLAQLLSTLAERNSVDSFYRGDIAQRLAEAFQKNHGLVTAKDLAEYHAREVEPLRLSWNGMDIFTPPPTAGSLTILEACSILKALDWASMPDGPASTHAQLESLRLAWKDRLELLGDPEKVDVPIEKLLSTGYASEMASKVKQAVNSKKALPIEIQKHLDEGTNNISCVDHEGNMVAVTLTQGSSFGAQVTANGLGLTLGHGMSRFDPHPDRPNSPGPGKRPLHNMCPSAVVRDGKPIMAVGAAGGVRIPNVVFRMLTQYVVRGATMEKAVAAPRMQTTGTLELGLEKGWPRADEDYLKEAGFSIKPELPLSSVVSAVTFNRQTGECRGDSRGIAEQQTH